jgi:antitoxin VapB
VKTARLFANGRSQAVRLPREFRFTGSDVYVHKVDNVVMLFPAGSPWLPLLNSLDRFSPDFMASRNQPKQQKRPALR